MSDATAAAGSRGWATVRELVLAGSVALGEFRSAPTDTDFARAGSITRHCFVFPRLGVWIHHENRPPFVADSTRITFYNPQQAYERRALDPEGDRSDWVAVSEAVAREVIGRYDQRAADSGNRVFREPYAASASRLYLIQRRLHRYVRTSAVPDLLHVEECALELFRLAAAGLYGGQRLDGPNAPLTPQQRDTVEAACAYLNRCFVENESLTAVAQRLGTSVFHLCRIFRRGTGLTVHAYRHHLRLRRSLEALERPGGDLLTLALELGYWGHSHYTAAFRRQFGIAPSKLRQQWMQAARGRPSATGTDGSAGRQPHPAHGILES